MPGLIEKSPLMLAMTGEYTTVFMRQSIESLVREVEWVLIAE